MSPGIPISVKRNRQQLSRRRFLWTGAIFVPTFFSAGRMWGSVRLTGIEAETASWMSRVRSNSGGYTSLSVVASDYAMKIAMPLRSKLLRWNLYCGIELAACLVPLINAKGNTLDNNINFVSGDYSESTGLTGNTTSKAITTGFLPSTGWSSVDDCSLGVYLRTKTSALDVMLGSVDGASAASYMSVAYGGTTNYGVMHSIASGTHYATGTDSNGLGFYITVRNASNSLVLYRNGVSQYSTTTLAGSLNANEMTVHAQTTGVGIRNGFSDRTFGGYVIAKGLSATEAAILYTAVQRANTILGRQV